MSHASFRIRKRAKTSHIYNFEDRRKRHSVGNDHIYQITKLGYDWIIIIATMKKLICSGQTHPVPQLIFVVFTFSHSHSAWRCLWPLHLTLLCLCLCRDSAPDLQCVFIGEGRELKERVGVSSVVVA
ncbi:uncharacterized protein DMAD_07666 [Drosophila madeirensis]|uniref:Uncharacterized protein n=1 Tax=Drosophila madeirensis TaxID=30013 RepID=A0AAU9ESP9_DROMD